MLNKVLILNWDSEEHFSDISFTLIWQVGTVAHEVGHAIGFKHEQSRPDRDSHVKVNEENVISSKLHNFDKYPDTYLDDKGVPYDYTSNMHYGAKVSHWHFIAFR